MCLVALLPAREASSEILGNPGTQVGEKNLFVGVEYSTAMQTLDIDTKDLDTTSEKINVKVTTGLSDWFDLYFRAGAANMTLDYKSNDYIHKSAGVSRKWGNSATNYDSDFGAGFGAGTRIRLLNFVNSRTRVFFDGGGYFYKTDGDIRWDLADGSVITKKRDMQFADIYAGVGIAKRMDYVDFTCGIGFSEAWWRLSDENFEQVGAATTRTDVPDRDSFEIKKPLFGFIGLDFVLPLEYRLSLQAGVRSADDAEFTVAISQGLEKNKF